MCILRRAARPDEDVSDVLEAALGLVAVKERVDFAQHDATRTAVAAHMAPDQRECEVMDGEVDHRSCRADVSELRRPRVEVIDVDQAHVEIDIDIPTHPPRVQIGKERALKLLRGGDPNALELATKA